MTTHRFAPTRYYNVIGTAPAELTVASGDTVKRAALALRHAGAERVIACAAHGLFTGNAPEVLDCPAIDRLLVTDSVPPFRWPVTGPMAHKLGVVSAVPLFARAIRGCRIDVPS